MSMGLSAYANPLVSKSPTSEEIHVFSVMRSGLQDSLLHAMDSPMNYIAKVDNILERYQMTPVTVWK